MPSMVALPSRSQKAWTWLQPRALVAPPPASPSRVTAPRALHAHPRRNRLAAQVTRRLQIQTAPQKSRAPSFRFSSSERVGSHKLSRPFFERARLQLRPFQSALVTKDSDDHPERWPSLLEHF